MKKIIITFLTMMIVFASMTVSVFAWFYQDNQATASNLSGSLGTNKTINIDASFDFQFELPTLEDLTYVTKEALDNVNTPMQNLSTQFKVEVKNNSSEMAIISLDINLNLGARNVAGQYSSSVEGSLLYVHYIENELHPLLNHQGNALAVIKNNNKTPLEILPGETKTVVFEFWAYYDALVSQSNISNSPKTYDDKYYLYEIYYALIYRAMITMKSA